MDASASLERASRETYRAFCILQDEDPRCAQAITQLKRAIIAIARANHFRSQKKRDRTPSVKQGRLEW